MHYLNDRSTFYTSEYVSTLLHFELLYRHYISLYGYLFCILFMHEDVNILANGTECVKVYRFENFVRILFSPFLIEMQNIASKTVKQLKTLFVFMEREKKERKEGKEIEREK